MSIASRAKRVLRRLLGLRTRSLPADSNPNRAGEFRRFLEAVAPLERKMQVGVRGEKYGPDWESVDLYDTSPLVDHNWDLQNLPVDDGTYDAIVCNAILEHVREAELAIYEMHRVLKPGGQIWVEIPFLQAFHAHPHDYWRVTLPGMRRWFEDFDEVSAGAFEGFLREAVKLYIAWADEVGISGAEQDRTAATIEEYVTVREREGRFSSSVYTASYFRGRKSDPPRQSAEKRAYFEYRKSLLK
jgi:predicted SAM-dependent methyltransferase